MVHSIGSRCGRCAVVEVRWRLSGLAADLRATDATGESREAPSPPVAAAGWGGGLVGRRSRGRDTGPAVSREAQGEVLLEAAQLEQPSHAVGRVTHIEDPPAGGERLACRDQHPDSGAVHERHLSKIEQTSSLLDSTAAVAQAASSAEVAASRWPWTPIATTPPLILTSNLNWTAGALNRTPPASRLQRVRRTMPCWFEGMLSLPAARSWARPRPQCANDRRS